MCISSTVIHTVHILEPTIMYDQLYHERCLAGELLVLDIQGYDEEWL